MQLAATLLELEPVIFARSFTVLQLHQSEQFEQLSLHVLVI